MSLFVAAVSFPANDQLMDSCWFGLVVWDSKGTLKYITYFFHKGIPGIQTTNPNQQPTFATKRLHSVTTLPTSCLKFCQSINPSIQSDFQLAYHEIRISKFKKKRLSESYHHIHIMQSSTKYAQMCVCCFHFLSFIPKREKKHNSFQLHNPQPESHQHL